jgi:hypothetical protein
MQVGGVHSSTTYGWLEAKFGTQTFALDFCLHHHISCIVTKLVKLIKIAQEDW